MKYRPILFSGEMVRAILDGRKTMTRRVVSSQPASFTEQFNHATVKAEHPPAWFDNVAKRCKYGVPGDRLWVRETFQPLIADGFDWFSSDYETGNGIKINYVADTGPVEFYDEDDRLSMAMKPSIYMPRWASRITLEIVSVKVDRLQDISDADARAEGAPELDMMCGTCRGSGTHPYGDPCDCDAGYRTSCPPLEWFQLLWGYLNAKKPGCSWDDNPWVWVVEFKKVESSGI